MVGEYIRESETRVKEGRKDKEMHWNEKIVTSERKGKSLQTTPTFEACPRHPPSPLQ